ncbi:hypothetical protein OK006_10732, partial [Actinobacteria bacterium OK006]
IGRNIPRPSQLPQFCHLFRGEIHTRLNDHRSLRFHEQHHETLVVSGMSQYWLEEIEDTIDDRTTATERANFTGFIESFVRNILQLSQETGRQAATTADAQHALERAAEFTLHQRPVIPQRGDRT